MSFSEKNNQLILQAFENLRGHIKNDQNKFKYDVEDIRYSFPNQLDKILIYNNLNFRYFINMAKGKKYLDTILKTGSKLDYINVLRTYHTQARNSLIFGLSSVFERFIRVLFDALKIKRKQPINFYAVRKALCKFLDIEDWEEWNAVSVLSNIRNTFHNNGVHTSEQRIINYRGRRYEFKPNFIHNNASYVTLLNIVTDIHNLYLQLCNVEEVKKIDFIKS